MRGHGSLICPDPQPSRHHARYPRPLSYWRLLVARSLSLAGGGINPTVCGGRGGGEGGHPLPRLAVREARSSPHRAPPPAPKAHPLPWRGVASLSAQPDSPRFAGVENNGFKLCRKELVPAL